eukprot:TRINITY_DN3973_c0_g8_i1.p1 TRINITY_DN3973_c0_g8~~TRINITY_DN3973_c0_g8_i1.p1  ORF type:complete len:255 (+),score=122.02 TRINITY_DN3973_c0_g8_i1:69-833(+)
MSALAPKSLLDKANHAPLTGPDGYTYYGLPDDIKDGLAELWDKDCGSKERKKELAEWDKKIRLAMTLGQVAVPQVPVPREVREAQMRKKAVAAQGAGGWATGNRPVGQRMGPGPDHGASGWGGVAPVAARPTSGPRAIPGAAPAGSAAEKKEKKKADKPKKEKKVDDEAQAKPAEEIKEAQTASQDTGFQKKVYENTTNALRNITKKIKQVEKIRDDGAKDDAQKAKVDTLPELKREQTYIQSLVNRGVTSQKP